MGKVPSGVVFEPVEVLSPPYGWLSYHSDNIYHVVSFDLINYVYFSAKYKLFFTKNIIDSVF